jgi:hypothetical protein
VIEAPPQPVAVLHQAEPAPAVRGARKPMKRGGYRDSGADIAFILRQAGLAVITPEADPPPEHDTGWTFADTAAGIRQAIERGARALWANTVLHATHPITLALREKGIRVVGQPAELVERFDDKWATNELLRTHGLPVAAAFRIGAEALTVGPVLPRGVDYPLVVKPLRGRGSEGVKVVAGPVELRAHLGELLDSGRYGEVFLAEEYLPGIEATLTVLPPGRYEVGIAEARFSQHWALPPVVRLSHEHGIAPYSGRVPVSANSRLIDAEERMGMRYAEVLRHCERAADLIGARAPIRIDVRASATGQFLLFDVNMKPNMTGPGRPGRDDQDSLTAIAARAVGWTYPELLINILRQAWGMA